MSCIKGQDALLISINYRALDVGLSANTVSPNSSSAWLALLSPLPCLLWLQLRVSRHSRPPMSGPLTTTTTLLRLAGTITRPEFFAPPGMPTGRCRGGSSMAGPPSVGLLGPRARPLVEDA